MPGGARPTGRAPLRTLLLYGVEGFLATAGVLLVLRTAVVRAQPALAEATAGREFDRLLAEAGVAGPEVPPLRGPDGEAESEPDCSDWSSPRIRGFEVLRKQRFRDPLARLEIPTIGLSALVFAGTDNRTLDRGIGHVAGTPRPGEPGNVALAAHRDGFFRGLEKLGPGDEMRLVTPHGCATYRTTKIDIVTPDDVACLEPTDDSRLTLVTCYPFRFVGQAPLRFILRAEKIDSRGSVAGKAFDARAVAPRASAEAPPRKERSSPLTDSTLAQSRP